MKRTKRKTPRALQLSRIRNGRCPSCARPSLRPCGFAQWHASKPGALALQVRCELCSQWAVVTYRATAFWMRGQS